MATGRSQAIEKTAQQIVRELRASRVSRFKTSDATFQRDVMVRVNQILSGDVTPRFEDADD